MLTDLRLSKSGGLRRDKRQHSPAASWRPEWGPYDRKKIAALLGVDLKDLPKSPREVVDLILSWRRQASEAIRAEHSEGVDQRWEPHWTEDLGKEFV